MTEFFTNIYYAIVKTFGNLYDNISAAISYSIFLWNNHYEWDHDYLLKLIEFKLKRMRRFYLSSKNIWMIDEQKDQIVAEINEVLHAIDTHYNKIHTQPLLDSHYEKWGRPELRNLPERPGLFEMVCENVKSDEDRTQEYEELTAVLNLVDNKDNEVFHNIFLLLAKYMRNWWD